MKDQTCRIDRPEDPSTALNPTGGAGNGQGIWAEKESRCEGPTLSKVLERENLDLAWKQVRANKGAPGVDGMSIEEFPRLIREHGDSILAKLKAGTYQPSPVKRVEIPKPDGTKRALGIPTVLDRVIQQAIAQVLTPFYDPGFSEHSHGFRPGRSAHGAIRELQRESNVKRKGWAVDCDLKSFFDTVDHCHLMKRLREGIADRQLLDLIGRYLKAGAILPDGALEASLDGVPQGGPLSPLLANILLDELDRELEARGHSFCRYADDFIILCGSPRAGKRIMQSVKNFVQNRLKLIVNEAKSKVVEICEATFLGFQLVRKQIRWSEKSKESFKARIREITHRTRGVSPVRVTAELASYVRGALNYYEPGVHFKESRNLDQWLRRRMRLYYWKQWGRPRTRRRKLLSLGIGRDEVHLASRSRKGPWRMSHNSIVQRAMTNQWLSDQGVPSIEKQWVTIRYPDGPKKGKKV